MQSRSEGKIKKRSAGFVMEDVKNNLKQKWEQEWPENLL
jgi:hypothetical protein